MKIRDIFASVNNDATTHEFESGGVEILGDDGRALYSIRLLAFGGIEVSTGTICKHEGLILDSRLQIVPKVTNVVIIERMRYES